MSNEELVALIQGGERDRLPELWRQVERFVAVQAHKRLVLSGSLGGVEFGDLYNAGYIALVAAAGTYDPLAGKSFIGWLATALKTAFAEAGGYRSRSQSLDPLHHAKSIDAPAGEDSDTAIGELIADPAAALALQNAEDGIWRKQLHDALEKALAELPARQGGTLRSRFYQARTLDEIAAAEGVHKETVRQWQEKGLRALRRRQELQQFVEERTPYYLRVGVGEFQRTGESAVERIVIRRERLAEPKAERPKPDRAHLEEQAAAAGEDYINAIEDPFIRISLRLRFLCSLSWKEVAAVTGGGKTGTAVRDICLRYLDRHPSRTPHTTEGRLLRNRTPSEPRGKPPLPSARTESEQRENSQVERREPPSLKA